MTSGDADPDYPEPSLVEFASELTAAADDALSSMHAGSRRERFAGPKGETPRSIDIQTIMKIPVTMKVVVGSATIPVSELKNLKSGETISLNRRVGEPVDVVVNGQILARGVLVIVDKETSQLGLSLTEVVGAGGTLPGPAPSKR